MKLRKQAPAKALILAAAAGLLASLLALIKSEPRLVESGSTAPQPDIDYRRFFAPAVGGAPDTTSSTPAVRPHTRTRAS
jgi:hypothetical protein